MEKQIKLKKSCFICKDRLRIDNTIGFCRKHRIKSPILKEQHRLYHQKNKDKRRIVNKEWRKNNPEKVNAIYARYRKTEKRKKIAREWARKNRKAGLRRFVERYHIDPQFNIAIKFRRRIYMAVRKQYTDKAKTTIELLGCSYQQLKEHIEHQFRDGMSWDLLLKGEIHLDHIRPLATFDLTKESEQKKAFHYTNLQPLWAEDNLRKGAKLS